MFTVYQQPYLIPQKCYVKVVFICVGNGGICQIERKKNVVM